MEWSKRGSKGAQIKSSKGEFFYVLSAITARGHLQFQVRKWATDAISFINFIMKLHVKLLKLDS